jgi:NTE family protein
MQPAKIHGKEYLDGGILNPIPLNLLPKKEIGDLIVAVDLNGPKEAFVSIEKDKKDSGFIKLPQWLEDYKEKFAKYTSGPEKEEKIKGMSSLDLLNYSFDLLTDKLSELVIQKHNIDILVEISRTQAGTLEFHRASELIEIGRNKTFKAIAQYEHGSKQTQ